MQLVEDFLGQPIKKDSKIVYSTGGSYPSMVLAKVVDVQSSRNGTRQSARIKVRRIRIDGRKLEHKGVGGYDNADRVVTLNHPKRMTVVSERAE